MKNFFVISPRIKVTALGEFEVSFGEEETANNKAWLKEQVGKITPAELGNYGSVKELATIIAKQIRRAGLAEAELRRSHSVEETLARFTFVPVLAELYNQPQPIWEGYTTFTHSLGVAKTLAILAPQESMKTWPWVLAGLLHDLGKTVAAFFEHDAKKGRKLQGYYNREIATAILQALDCDQRTMTYVLTLITESSLPYQYVTGELNFEDVKNTLELLISTLQENGYATNALELLEDLKTFWVADGSDYSAIACLMKGLPLKPSFDSQFIYVFTISDVSDQWTLSNIKLKDSWQTKYEGLLKKLGG